MNSKIEKQENSTVKLSINIPNERFEEGMDYSYKKNRASISLPGFRKGKAPRALIEKQYGKEVFIDDAINYVFPDAYEAAIKEHSLDTVSRPEIDVMGYDKEKGLDLDVVVTVKPEVKLGEYKGLTYTEKEAEVTEQEIDEEINKVREKNARIVSLTDTPVEDGHTAVIDFEGFVDGVPFEGGKGADYELVIGSKSFIDTFEEQLIGKNVGDDAEVNVTFPENYGNEELAGKPAMFKVEIKDITKKELPEADDDFAMDVSEFDTIDEYKNSIKETLIHQKEHEKEHAKEDELIKKAAENAEVAVPQVMIENQINQMMQEFASRLQAQGLDFNTFLQYSGQTPEAFKEGYREAAERNVKARLVLEAIAEAEKLEPTDEDIQAEVSRIAKVYGIDEDKMKEMMRPDDLKGLAVDLKTQQALKLLSDTAKKE